MTKSSKNVTAATAATSAWRARKKMKDQELIDAYNAKHNSSISLTIEQEFTMKGKARPCYDPPPEVMATMSKEQLSSWRAKERNKRKAAKACENRAKKKQMLQDIKSQMPEFTSKISKPPRKANFLYNPPPEMMAAMNADELREWRANERRKRNSEKQREIRAAKKEREAASKVQDQTGTKSDAQTEAPNPKTKVFKIAGSEKDVREEHLNEKVVLEAKSGVKKAEQATKNKVHVPGLVCKVKGCYHKQKFVYFPKTSAPMVVHGKKDEGKKVCLDVKTQSKPMNKMDLEMQKKYVDMSKQKEPLKQVKGQLPVMESMYKDVEKDHVNETKKCIDNAAGLLDESKNKKNLKDGSMNKDSVINMETQMLQLQEIKIGTRGNEMVSDNSTNEFNPAEALLMLRNSPKSFRENGEKSMEVQFEI